MYKVFINNKPLLLTSQKSVAGFSEKNILNINFDTEKEIRTAIDILYFDADFSGAIIFSDDEQKLWKKFCEQFIVLEAAGGLVLNEKKELLMIYRFDKWDFPKGKIEENEKPNEAALREVCEETGVCDVEIVKELLSTYHTYHHHKDHILKKTYWFKMKCIPINIGTQFKLQDEEGIKDAQWMNNEQLKEAMKNTYPSIAELLKFFPENSSV